MASIARLRRAGVPFNVLCLLTADNVGDPDGLWRFFQKHRLRHLQLVNRLDRDAQGAALPGSVDGPALARFYTRLFDRWIEQGFPHVSVRLFEDVLIWLLDGVHVSCNWMPACDAYLVVEHNGDVYPCDFYVTPEWRLGNLHETPLAELARSPARRAFAHRKAPVASRCAPCELRSFCHGDCPKFRAPCPAADRSTLAEAADRSTLAEAAEPGLSVYCEATRQLFAHVRPHLPRIARRVAALRRRQPAKAAQRASTRGSGLGRDSGSASAAASDSASASGKPKPRRVGRNAPCPCGSGKKHKRCCGKEERS
jgi:uncharacterized protein